MLRNCWEVSAAAIEAHGPGLFVRSMVGLDTIATQPLSAFTPGSTLTGNQLAFFDLPVNQLTQRGVVNPELIYETPSTEFAPTGPNGLFASDAVMLLVAALRRIRSTAEVS